MSQPKKQNWDKVLAISTTVIALVAVVVSIWQGIETRKHNRLSVKPILDLVYVNKYEPEKTYPGIYLENYGVGPAIIKEVIVKLDGKPYYKSGNVFYFDFIGGYLRKDLIGDTKVLATSIGINMTLPKGEKLSLVTFMTKDQTPGVEKELVRLLNGLAIYITYQSVYGETFKLVFSAKTLK
ncbi:hypothetical protein KJ966_24770 [bacterium]|nr:hypothetical protein [bacterium]